MVGEMPRDSLMAQMISFSTTPVVVTAVRGLVRPVKGREVAGVCLFDRLVPVAVL